MAQRIDYFWFVLNLTGEKERKEEKKREGKTRERGAKQEQREEKKEERDRGTERKKRKEARGKKKQEKRKYKKNWRHAGGILIPPFVWKKIPKPCAGIQPYLFILMHFPNRCVKTAIVLAVSCGINLSGKFCPVPAAGWNSTANYRHMQQVSRIYLYSCIFRTAVLKPPLFWLYRAA